MAAVHAFDLADLVQAEAVEHHICSFCQCQRFFFQFGVLAAGAPVALCVTDAVQRIAVDGLYHGFDLERIDQRGPGPLIAGGDGKVTD